MSATEIDAFNEAVADTHEACNYAREIRDAYECGDLEISDAEGRELFEMLKEKVETCERWQTALRFPKITVPAPLPDEDVHPHREPAVAYVRVGRFGIVSYGAGPNSSFGNTAARPGDWHGR